jgi:gliding motility-associated protein GldL
MLSIGLLTEALIFALSAFEPVDDELDWTLVYPELANGVKGPAKLRKLKLPLMRKVCYLRN